MWIGMTFREKEPKAEFEARHEAGDLVRTTLIIIMLYDFENLLKKMKIFYFTSWQMSNYAV